MALTRRRKRVEVPGKFSQEAIEAYLARDWLRLRTALQMKPWEWGREAVFSHPRVQALKAYIDDANDK